MCSSYVFRRLEKLTAFKVEKRLFIWLSKFSFTHFGCNRTFPWCIVFSFEIINATIAKHLLTTKSGIRAILWWYTSWAKYADFKHGIFKIPAGVWLENRRLFEFTTSCINSGISYPPFPLPSDGRSIQEASKIDGFDFFRGMSSSTNLNIDFTQLTEYHVW